MYSRSVPGPDTRAHCSPVRSVGLATSCRSTSTPTSWTGHRRTPGPATATSKCTPPTGSHTVTDFAVPLRYVNAVHRAGDEPPAWISARALHDQPTAVADALAAELAAGTPEAGFLHPSQCASFAAYLLATTFLPASAGTQYGWGLGLAARKSLAVVLHDGSLLAAGSDKAVAELTALREHWRAWHEPSQPHYKRIAATVSLDADGWVVRSTIA